MGQSPNTTYRGVRTGKSAYDQYSCSTGPRSRPPPPPPPTVAFRLRCVRLMWPVAVRWAYVETYSRVCERKTEHRSTASRSGHCTVSV